jgi:hypothetical protein
MGVHTPAMKNCVKSFRLQSANSDYLDPVPSVIVSGAPANKKIGHFRVAYFLLCAQVVAPAKAGVLVKSRERRNPANLRIKLKVRTRWP